MILKILAVIVALVTVSPLAMASTADGPYVGLGMGFYNTDLKVTSGVTKVVFGDDKHDVGADVFAGYKWNMGTGSISTEASYTSSYGKATNVALGANTLSSELKNGMAISVLPGYALSKETTAFVRVGYTRVKGERKSDGNEGIASVRQSTAEKMLGYSEPIKLLDGEDE